MANRAQRRAFNKKNKTKLTKEEYETLLALERIKHGNFDLRGLDLPYDVVHMDNEELAPVGMPVMLNYERIQERFKKGAVDETNAPFREWVESNKDKVFHLSREGVSKSLVCLEEDLREVEIDGEKKRAPQWLFDLYSDLLIQDKDGEWKMLSQLDSNMDTYYDVKVDTEKIKEEEKKSN